MGVYIRYGDLTINNNVTIVGTVIVTGTLETNVWWEEWWDQSSITAQPGFPAIVAQGEVIIGGGDGTMTVNGTFIVRGTVQSNNAQNGMVITNGPVIFLDSGSGFASSLPGISFTINHDESRMDLTGLFP